ncbi:MAG: hypothetical protein ONB44_20800 [candidate division KSB1 bacterium]|nr:hypothetical protein [candidate division KSB1 bacterium]MDZ7304572.1 hypothetical protein [candidate division KSB1 bacterium]MDZ7313633.1 hypothetical protein [candidate division KSB1 bacterium]
MKLNRSRGIDRDCCGIVAVIDAGSDQLPVLDMGASPYRVESGPAVQGADLELRHLRTVGQGEFSRSVDIAWDDRGILFDSLDDPWRMKF